MQSSDIPLRIQLPFAASAGGTFIRTVPVPSQIGITDGAASFTTGFVPDNFLPAGAGGVPPFGQDFNGLLNVVTAWNRWQCAGSPVTYNADFSTAIGGYPEGAILAAAALDGNMWISAADNNTSNPDASGANWYGFNVAAIHLQPTTTVITATGAGTFTTPVVNGVKAVRLKIRMCGGGGSGGSTGTPTGNIGNVGGTTTFDGVTAVGGAAGNRSTGNGGAGGFSTTPGSGTADLRIPGGAGTTGATTNTNVDITIWNYPLPGVGGTNPFGGGGPNRFGTATLSPADNTGAGSAGASTNVNVAQASAGGGQAGEYVELSRNAVPGMPLADTYAYILGDGGAAPVQGTAGIAGAKASAGIIIVEASFK